MPYVAPTTSSNPQPNPINRYSARASYFGETGYSPSAGLERARRPFRVRNALTGLGIMSFVASVYFYSISAVKQDDFSDLPATAPNAGKEGIKTIEEELAEKTSKAGIRGVGAIAGLGSSPQGQGVRVKENVAAIQSNPQKQVPSPQPTPLSSPLPQSSYAAAAAATVTFDDALPTASTSRSRSRFIVGAPDVDRIGTLSQRSDLEATIDGRRVA